MTSPNRLSIVDAGDLPQYPVPKGERLDSHSWVPFHFNRWRDSDFHLKSSAEVECYGLSLFFFAQNQDPVGTLPDDDLYLSKLLMLDLATWQELKNRDIGPLYKWTPCMCGTEVRLHHPVVTELVVAAVKSKVKNASDRAEGRRRKRMDGLTEKIGRIGHSMMAKDAILVNRIASWLEENCDGNWTEGWVIKALESDANES